MEYIFDKTAFSERLKKAIVDGGYKKSNICNHVTTRLGDTEKNKEKHLKMERTTLNSLLNGKSVPSIEQLYDIANFFGCSIEYFLCIDECTDRDTEYIHRETGLSQSAIEFFRSNKNTSAWIIDFLASNVPVQFDNMINDIGRSLSFFSVYSLSKLKKFFTSDKEIAMYKYLFPNEYQSKQLESFSKADTVTVIEDMLEIKKTIPFLDYEIGFDEHQLNKYDRMDDNSFGIDYFSKLLNKEIIKACKIAKEKWDNFDKKKDK